MKVRLSILLLLLMVMGMIPSVRAQTLINVIDVSWGTQVSPIEVEPGDRNVPLQITLVNYQPTTIEDVSSKLILPDGMKDSLTGSGEIEKSYAGRIQPGQSFSFSYSIDIIPSMTIGSHKAKFKLYYKNLGSSSVVEQDYTLSLRVTGKSKLELSLETLEIPAGSKSKVMILLRNWGSAQASGIEIYSTFPSSQSSMGATTPTITLISPDGHWSVKNLGPGEECGLEMLIDAPEATSGNSYSITFTISYYNTYGNLVQVTRKLGLKVGEREVDKVELNLEANKVELTPGKESRLKVTIGNGGSVDVKDLEASFSFPSGLLIIEGNSTFRIGELMVGKSVALDLSVFAPQTVANSAASMTVTLTYKDMDGNEQVESRSLGLRVKRVSDVSVIDVSWGTQVSPIEVEPGDRNVPLQITLVNNGADPITDVKGELLLPDGFTSDSMNHATNSYSGSVMSGSPFTLNYVMSIDSSLSVGEYNATLALSYRKLGEEQVFVSTHGLKLEVEGRSELKASLIHDGMKAGAVNEATLVLKNEGTATASDITMTLGPMNQVILLNSDKSWRVKELGPSDLYEAGLELFIPEVLSRSSVSIPITITYYDTNGNQKVVQRELGFKVSAPDVEKAKLELGIEPFVLIPIQENNITLAVRNVGDSPLSDVKIDLVTSPLTLLSGDEHFELGELSPNSTVGVPVNLFVPSSYEGASNSIKATISYKDAQGNERVESRQIGYRVGGSVKAIDIKLTLLNPVLEPDSANVIRINVTNSGLKVLARVRLEFNPPQLATGSPISILSVENRVEVKWLNPEESRILELPVFVSESASGMSLQLPVELKLVDADGVEKVEERSLGTTVTKMSKENKLILEGGGEVLAGKVNVVELNISNTLDHVVQDIIVDFKGENSLTFVGSEKTYIPSLGPGEEKTVRLSVFPDPSILADKVARLRAEVEYKDPGGVLKREETEIGIVSRGQIILSVSDVKFSYVAGIPTVTGDLLNEGNVDALFSRARIEGEIEGKEEVFIGDVSQGVTVPFSIPVKIPSWLEEGRYNLTLNIAYRNGFREERTTSIPISIDFYQLQVEKIGSSSEHSIGSAMLWSIVGVAAIAVAVTVYALRKRRT